MPTTGIVRIADTLQYIPKTFAFPKTATEDYLQQAIRDIIAIKKNPPKTLPLFLYGDVTKNAVNQIAQILHRSTSQPQLQNFTLAATAYTDSECKSSTSKYPPYTSTIYKRGSFFATYYGENTPVSTHNTHKTAALYITQLGYRSKSMD